VYALILTSRTNFESAWIVDIAGKIVRIHRLTQAKSYSEETHAKGMIA
jgi:hypothetical protein